MTEAPQIGRLVPAALRDAWPHEAYGFTPWLVENLDHIGEAMGVRLEAEGSEVRVGRFSADILARNLADDTLVLIENQLEAGDHNHLGQILTYLAGLEAKTVVWIASSFTDEHLSALNWLNQHTEDGYSFFAIKVRVVRIGESPFAPIFEVVERPNTWDREVHAVAESTGRSELSLKRFEFWMAYCDRVPGEEARDGKPDYWSNRWRVLTDPDLIISIYAGKDQVGIFLRPPRNGSHEEMFELLSTKETELTSRLGVPIGNYPKHFFSDAKKGDYTDASQRESLIDWPSKRANDYEKAVRAAFGEGTNRVSF